ncbi:MAG TPA: histidinol-phosphate transaminase [Methanoregulaceae archaeon]|nr:histidinol-phosphate transaminase [Methanoregulaceae archaeon]
MTGNNQDTEVNSENGRKRLVRGCFAGEGYVFAKKAEDIALEHGLERVARLASNENPEPPGPQAIEEGCRALRQSNRYPDENMGALTEMLRQYHGGYHFVTGVGMDGIIETIIRLLVDRGDSIAISIPTFSFYELAATAQGGQVIRIPRENDFSVDCRKFADIARNAKVSFLCTPNNPTGNETPPEEVAELLEELEGILFVDNAYVEFSDMDYRYLMDRYDNLVLGRTMSKAFSMAGLRVGYAFVPEWILPFYRSAATPFTLNSVSAAAATAALRDREHVSRIVSQVKRWRKRYRDECAYPVLPSAANFVLVDTAPFTGDQMAEKLAARGVVVRSCRSFRGLDDRYIRVGIGEDWENERFLEEINSI